MPVLDHEVHPSTKIGPDHRYGCWNREPFKDGYGFKSHLQNMAVLHRMSTDCRFDMSLSDPHCDGCTHRGSGEAYDQHVRNNGSDKP